jgi:LPXTG-motif cell wall-anchored protein
LLAIFTQLGHYVIIAIIILFATLLGFFLYTKRKRKEEVR